MKAKILVFLLFTLGFLPVMAQNTHQCSSGIMAGVSSGSVRLSGFDSRVAGVVHGDNIFGMEAGFFTKINIKPLYFKPAVMIHYMSGMVDVYNTEGMAYAKSDFKMTRLQVPVMFGINICHTVNAELGLVYNHVLGITTKYNGYDTSVPRDGVGYRAGVNAAFDRLTLGINYQAIANRAISKGTFDTPDELILSAAYTFGANSGTGPYGRK